jgi:adenosylhomocysteine nucleosidase
MTRLAIVAALEREIKPLVKNWRIVERDHEGKKRFKFFEDGAATVLVCGGIGEHAARRATEAVINLYQPEIVQSVGFAGALDSRLTVGQVFSPSRVIDGKDGSSTRVENGNGALLSFHSIAGAEQKSKLARAYGAQAIDMEAAAVAKTAESHGIRFAATKVISDEFDFEMPSLDRFITHDGQFQPGRFAAFVAVRPWLWVRVIGLGRKSAKAAQALCHELQRQQNAGLETQPELGRSLRV